MVRNGALDLRPLLHFLVIGLVLFVGDRVLARWTAAPERQRIVIGAERVRQIESDFAQRIRALPTERERAALIRDAVDEEIMLREALALGLLHTDAVVRRRVLQNARFIGMEHEDEQALFEEALEVELHLSDPVVRRRLVQRVRMMIEGAVREGALPEEDVVAHYTSTLDRWIEPRAVAITHAFFGREESDAHVARAVAALERIRSDGLGADEAVRLGDPFLRGHELGARSRRELGGIFGPAFAEAAIDLPAGEWSGPVESAYGVHLVLVREVRPERQRPLEEVRRRVADEVYARRERERLREVLDRLREHYDIEVVLAPEARS